MERREKRIDFAFANHIETWRHPTRCLILVDQRGTHTFIEIVPLHHARHDAEFHALAGCEIEFGTIAHLAERDFETRRRAALENRRSLTPPIALDFQPLENLLDR